MQFAIYTLTLLGLAWPLCVMAGGSGGQVPQGVTGGRCTYKEIHGRAVITEVKDADPAAYNCRDGVEVVFTFVPDDPSARDNYRFAQHPDTGLRFVLGAGMNPPRKWALDKGLVQGAIHRCIRQEMTHGACTPVVFAFPDLDLADWEKDCF